MTIHAELVNIGGGMNVRALPYRAIFPYPRMESFDVCRLRHSRLT